MEAVYTSFLIENHGQITKIAFIGDEKWKDEIFFFTGKPLGAMAMEFFAQERPDLAQNWLYENKL